MANENNDQKRYRRPNGSIFIQACIALHEAADRTRLATINAWNADTTDRDGHARGIVSECLDSSSPDGAPSKFRDLCDASIDLPPLKVALAVGHAMGKSPTDMVRAATEFLAFHDAAAKAFAADLAARQSVVVTDTTASPDTATIYDAPADAGSDSAPQEAPPAKRGPGRPSKSTVAVVTG